MTDKYRYTIYPERTYVIHYEGHPVEVQGSEIVNIIPDVLRQKYIDVFFRYESILFDNTQEGLVE